MENRLFNLCIYATNNWNIINRLTALFSKKQLIVNGHSSFTLAEQNTYQFNFELVMTQQNIEKLRKQILRFIDVETAFYSEVNETTSQEVALYKLSARELYKSTLKETIADNQATIIDITEQFLVIEKKGNFHQTTKLYKDLFPFGLLQFTRSGRATL